MSQLTPQVRRTRITLADGRDLFYFDDTPSMCQARKVGVRMTRAR